MRKLTLCIIAFLFVLKAVAQQSKEKEVMDLTIPQGVQKLTEQQFLNIQSQQFKQQMTDRSGDHLYEKDGILISYRNSSVPHVLKKSLESQQRMWASLISKEKGVIVTGSEIITVNNIRFLLIKHYDSNAATITFFSDYDNDLNFIAGRVDYEKGNDDKAKQFLQEMLQNMHFKN